LTDRTLLEMLSVDTASVRVLAMTHDMGMRMWWVVMRLCRGPSTSAPPRREITPVAAAETSRQDAGSRDLQPRPQDAPSARDKATTATGDRALNNAKLAQIIAGLVAPTTLITALALFFGWVRTSAQMYYFGLDPTLVTLSNQDYLLRSAEPIFIPLGALLLVILLAVWGHALAINSLQKHDKARGWVNLALIVVGCGLLIFGVVSAACDLRVATSVMLPQLSPGIGVALITYAGYLGGEQRHPANGNAAGTATAHRLALVVSATLATLVMVLSLFWAVSRYANALGIQYAQRYAATLIDQPSVDVYSKQRLYIKSGGVLEARIGDADSTYRFRYSGLRLLLRSGGSYYLLPASWSARHGVVIVLPEDQSMRFEYTTGTLR
jgi:hypothetical protein